MTEAADAWQRLLESLRRAGETIEGPLGARDERERAEGYRHLLRILSIADEMLLEKGDPARPRFTRWMSPYRKILGDNPHTHYDAALIDPSLTYRITGRRGAATYLGICVYGTAAGGARRIVANLDDTQMRIDDGRFEVWLSAARPGDLRQDVDFLQIDADATDVMIRQYFIDPASEDATYDIVAVPDPGPPPPLDEATVARRLDAVGSYVEDIVEVEASLSALMAMATPQVLRHGDDYVDAGGDATPPPVDPAIVAKAMPSPAIQYSGTWFDDLADDEAVVVSGSVPACRYWSIQLLTRWMESGDWVHHPVFLTGADIEPGPDGRFRAVVAHRDPGVDHWIATTGIRSGNVAVRSLGASDLLDVQFERVRLPLT